VGGIDQRIGVELSRFLLIYRGRSAVSTIVVEAASFADALKQAADFGLNAPNSFRLGHELEPDLAALVQPRHMKRILSGVEAKELLTMFRAHKSVPRHRHYLRAAE
jgi:hypothetical protein